MSDHKLGGGDEIRVGCQNNVFEMTPEKWVIDTSFEGPEGVKSQETDPDEKVRFYPTSPDRKEREESGHNVEIRLTHVRFPDSKVRGGPWRNLLLSRGFHVGWTHSRSGLKGQRVWGRVDIPCLSYDSSRSILLILYGLWVMCPCTVSTVRSFNNQS